MSRNKPKKEQKKPKTVVKGKRYRCARCLKRSGHKIKPPPTTKNPYICMVCKGV